QQEIYSTTCKTGGVLLCIERTKFIYSFKKIKPPSELLRQRMEQSTEFSMLTYILPAQENIQENVQNGMQSKQASLIANDLKKHNKTSMRPLQVFQLRKNVTTYNSRRENNDAVESERRRITFSNIEDDENVVNDTTVTSRVGNEEETTTEHYTLDREDSLIDKTSFI
ncbi:1409_t:CDS:2, partial [Ambispora leptoticha]